MNWTKWFVAILFVYALVTILITMIVIGMRT